jgi:hypothetical protein
MVYLLQHCFAVYGIVSEVKFERRSKRRLIKIHTQLSPDVLRLRFNQGLCIVQPSIIFFNLKLIPREF